MSRNTLRFAELIALVTVALGLIGLAVYMAYLGRMGEAFGSVITTVPLVVQAIRNIGQAQAMQSMADHLAQSAPA